MPRAKKDDTKVAGAVARAQALTPERRSAIAAQAAATRWGKTFVATHKGNFQEQFGIDVECYVLNDPMKTAVISQRGMGEAIGFSRRGSRFGVFVNSQTMAPFIGRELKEKIENPVVFQASPAAAGNPVTARAHGYEAGILIDICNSILAAKGAGKLAGAKYQRMTEQAQIIVSATAKNGIRQVVYALAGYSPSTDEVISAFKLYIQEEARKYEPEFPNELYMQWHRLYEIPVPVRGKPWHFKYLTINHVYYPLAKSNGKILQLLRATKSSDGDRAKKLFQFLNEIGARALRMHIGRLLEMAEDSRSRHEYERRVANRFGDQKELELVLPEPAPAD